MFTMTLLMLQEDLEAMSTCLENFGLPTPKKVTSMIKVPLVIQEEISDASVQREISENKCKNLNEDQQNAFCAIMKAVEDDTHQQRMFFLNAPGGYGKTFLIEALLSSVRSMGKIAVAVASSGIAAELLEGRRTAHS